MAEMVERQSAKIYTFPARGRFARSQAADNVERFPEASIGDAWYHDEAIREAVHDERPRRR